MKKYFGLFALSALLLVGAGCANEATTPTNTDAEADITDTAEETTMPTLAGTYSLDTENSTVTWEGKKVGGAHNGTIAVSEGSLMIDAGEVSGSAVIDMDSIVDLDLEGPSNQSLVDHLKSDDFFSVETYPTATFTFTSLTPKTDAEIGDQYTVEGTLLLRGVENDISFDATIVPKADGSLSMMADIELDRSRWNVQYGSATLLDIAADKAISDIMTIGLDVRFVSDVDYGDDALGMEADDSEDADEMEDKQDDDSEEDDSEDQK